MANGTFKLPTDSTQVPQTWIDMFEGRVIADSGVFENKANTLELFKQKQSTINKASLVLTPNGYKESKLHSFKPFAGNGDLSVVRATTATRVNSQGFIEETPYNLVRYSEQFENAAWSKRANITITPNTSISPDGNLTADKLTNSGNINPSEGIQQNVLTSNGPCTFSIYAKSGTTNKLNLLIKNASSDTIKASQNFTLTNDWVRYEISGITDGVTNGFRGEITTNANLGDIIIWGAQLVQGSTPKDYFPTTDRLNVPRIDYPIGGGCPSILVEPQRTNLALYSEQFDNALWGKTRCTVIPNVIVSPNGNLSADKLVEDSTVNSNHFIALGNVINGTAIYTASVYVKGGERNQGELWIGTSSPRVQMSFDLSTGIITSSSATGTAIINGISIVNIGEGWYRVILSGQMNNVNANYPFAVFLSNAGTAVYTGDGTSGIFIWGAQLEQGAYPTSYIPTVASAVTRNADAVSKTGISSLVNSQEGVFFLEIASLTNDSTFKNITLSYDSQNYLQVFFYQNTINFKQVINGVSTQQASTIIDVTSFNKIAFYWNSNGVYKTTINGIIQSPVTLSNISGSINNISFANISNAAFFHGKIKQLALFKTALTDAELIQLTTI